MSGKDYKDRRLFAAISDPGEQREVFKAYVHNVIVEASSHCNRKCGYCPVAASTRHVSNVNMDGAFFDAVIAQLASIDYNERVCLNLYNEPMSQLPMLLDRIRQTRAALPGAHIYFSTNGDYLNRENLEALDAAGLSSLIVSVHMPHEKPFDDKYIMSRFIELGVRCRARIKINVLDPNSRVFGDMKFKRMPIEVFAVNYYKRGYNRAGSVEKIKVGFKRRAPCIRPFSDFTVAYDGNVFPCCQFFPDLESSKKVAVGSMAKTPDIFAIYASEELAGWRRSLFTRSKKMSPCDTCGELNWEVSNDEMRQRDQFLDKEFAVPQPGLAARAIDGISALPAPAWARWRL